MDHLTYLISLVRNQVESLDYDVLDARAKGCSLPRVQELEIMQRDFCTAIRAIVNRTESN